MEKEKQPEDVIDKLQTEVKEKVEINWFVYCTYTSSIIGIKESEKKRFKDSMSLSNQSMYFMIWVYCVF